MTNEWINNLPGPKLAAVVEKSGDKLKERYYTDDVYFAIWLHTLNRVAIRHCGLSYDDLEDWDYYSAYEGDMSPSEAAAQMLEDNGLGYDD